MYKVLRYGALMGAPLSPAMEEMIKSQRESTRAVLLCFHMATGLSQREGREEQVAAWSYMGLLLRLRGAIGLSQGEGSEEQRAAWSCMGRIPLGVIENILLLADLEIPESFRRGVPDNLRTEV